MSLPLKTGRYTSLQAESLRREGVENLRRVLDLHYFREQKADWAPVVELAARH